MTVHERFGAAFFRRRPALSFVVATRRFGVLAAVLVALAVVGATACSSKADGPTGPSGASPRITGINPNVVQPSTLAQTITVQGETFVNGLTLEVTSPLGTSVSLGGNAIQGLASNAFQVDVVFDVAGNYKLQVRNANGLQSDTFEFQVGSPADSGPQITNISPATVVRGNQPVLVVLQGRNLTVDSVIMMTPPSGVGIVLGGNQIVSIASTEIDLNIVLNAAGTYTFTVTNGLGQSSTPISLTTL